jgi:hypothetical protein
MPAGFAQINKPINRNSPLTKPNCMFPFVLVKLNCLKRIRPYRRILTDSYRLKRKKVVLIVGTFSMLVNIEAFFFNAPGNAQSDG